jgi:F420-dependent oxidoreductase-like protein
MRVSLNITGYSSEQPPTDHLTEVVHAADEGGLDTVWVADHLLQMDPTSDVEAPMLEAYTTLGYLAARSTRVRLGTMVSAVSYRAPALLIKAVTTLDVLSGGRAWFGIGSGYSTTEAAAMGLPLPPVGERFELLEDTLRLALHMWSGEDAPFSGTRLELERPLGSPLPSTRPHPPILIGGMGERKTLRLVARYGDACNLFDIPDEGRTVRHKLGVLRAHCDAEGRPYDTIDKTISTRINPGESAEQFTNRCRTLGGLGIEHVVVITSGQWDTPRLQALAEAAAALAT